MKPARRSAGDPSRLTASLRAAHRCVSVGIHPVFLPHAPCQPSASPASALTRVPPPAVHHSASLRSALRFGRNTPGPVLPVGAPPSRGLSAGPPPGELAPPGELGLTGLGAHPGSTTGCWQPVSWQPVTRVTRPGSPGGGVSSDSSRLSSRLAPTGRTGRPATGNIGPSRRASGHVGRNTPGPGRRAHGVHATSSKDC